MSLVIRRLSDIPPEKVRWLWGHRFPLGKLSIISGVPGLGKSRISWDVAARVTRGSAWPDGDGKFRAPGGRVLMLVAEDGLADTVRPGLDAAGADCELVEVVDGFHNGLGKLEPITLERHLQEIQNHLALPRPGLRARLLIIDPLSAYMPGGSDGNKECDVRTALQPVVNLAGELGIAVLGVMHHAKGEKRAPIHRLLGSQAYGALARAVWMVERHPQDPSLNVMVAAKLNIAKPAPSLAFRIADTGAVEWITDAAEVSAEDTFPADDRKRKRPAVDPSADWLKEMLADGPVRSAELEAAGAVLGYDPRTITRAKNAIGARSENLGTQKGKRVGENDWWTLPSGSVLSDISVVSAPSGEDRDDREDREDNK